MVMGSWPVRLTERLEASTWTCVTLGPVAARLAFDEGTRVLALTFKVCKRLLIGNSGGGCSTDRPSEQVLTP